MTRVADCENSDEWEWQLALARAKAAATAEASTGDAVTVVRKISSHILAALRDGENYDTPTQPGICFAAVATCLAQAS